MSAGSLAPTVVPLVLSAPELRSDVLAHARDLLSTREWCHADEVAAALVDCLVGGELP